LAEELRQRNEKDEGIRASLEKMSYFQNFIPVALIVTVNFVMLTRQSIFSWHCGKALINKILKIAEICYHNSDPWVGSVISNFSDFRRFI
jgi:hypothetical protein